MEQDDESAMTDANPREHRLTVSRSARCFSQGGDAAVEAWVVLHGYGQLGSRFLRGFESIATPERLVVAPEGLSRFYLDTGSGKVGASWMTKEDRRHEIEDYLAYLEQVRAAVVPPVPLTILGFSQGVATAARWAVRTAPAPARLVCWGGLLPEEVPVARLAQLRLTYVVGEREEWAPPAAVEAQAATCRAAGVSVEVHRFDGGHEIRPSEVARLIKA
jgi:predicted esterase